MAESVENITELMSTALSLAEGLQSEPLPAALPPVAGASRQLFPNDLVSKIRHGAVHFGLVDVMHGVDDETDSDSDFDDSEDDYSSDDYSGDDYSGDDYSGDDCSKDDDSGERNCPHPNNGSDTERDNRHGQPLESSLVCVRWYPDGVEQDVEEKQLTLIDRALGVGETVQRTVSEDNQSGIVTNIHTECAVRLLGTNRVLYSVTGKDLRKIWPFAHGDLIAYDGTWLGRVDDMANRIVLKFSNGARCSMSMDEAEKLRNVHPHVSDNGLFCLDENFHPGQVLSGRAKHFSRARWLSGAKPYLGRKASRLTAEVEEVEVAELHVSWFSFSVVGLDDAYYPPSTLTRQHLGRVRQLDRYNLNKNCVGDRLLCRLPPVAEGDSTSVAFYGPPKGAPALPDYPVDRPLERPLRAGDWAAVEVVHTKTTADVMWKDGREEKGIRSMDLIPCEDLETDLFPGDLVVDQRPGASQDPDVCGVVQSADHVGRTCTIRWVKRNGDGVEAIGDEAIGDEEEDVSVYDIEVHPHYDFNIADVVVRVPYSLDPKTNNGCEKRTPAVGEVSRTHKNGKVEVVWSDGSRTTVPPWILYNMEMDEDFVEDEDDTKDETDGSVAPEIPENLKDMLEEKEPPEFSVEPTSATPVTTPTSAGGAAFSALGCVPNAHTFRGAESRPAEPKKFLNAVRKELALFSSSLPEGIAVKTFEDRMDLFSALIRGPSRTPYEDGLFLFDIQLPATYPAAPPLFHYLSQCAGRLNPNLYDDGKVCVSLLGTWPGHRATERWTSGKSNLTQVLVSIQGLVLVSEPYYNEPGLEGQRGRRQGLENSRIYGEMALIKTVQSATRLLQAPVEAFSQEIRQHFSSAGWRLAHRLEGWLDLQESTEARGKSACGSGGVTPESGDIYPDVGFPLFPLSKGFVKSVRIALSQYRAALLAAGISEHSENN